MPYILIDSNSRLQIGGILEEPPIALSGQEVVTVPHSAIMGLTAWSETMNGFMDVGNPIKIGDWIYTFLDNNFTTLLTANTVSPLAFTPEADAMYEVEGKLFLQSAATTTGARPGIDWPSGTLQNAGWAMSPSSATAMTSRFWGNTTTANAAATGVAVANEDIPGKVEATFVTGPAPSGDWAVTLATEIAASEARLMQNSFIRHRRIK